MLHATARGAPGRLFQLTRCFSNSSWLSAAEATTCAPRDVLGDVIAAQLQEMRAAGTYKVERVITTPQSTSIGVSDSNKPVLNFCANNYLGLSNNPDVVTAAKQALDTHGFGLSSVRFICGTQDLHKQLESRISSFYSTEGTILYPSCFDANAGLFEAILGPEDAVISDALNHASIIDGIRLCKAKRFRYAHGDMSDLEAQLKAATEAGARTKLIATDGVFSMDGTVAPLPDICSLAKKYGAVVFVDECHATGVIGDHGRGTEEYWGMQGQVDIVNSTLGKALGGATGGYTTGRGDVVDILRQKSRPYLFSNTLAPAVAAASLKVFDLLSSSSSLLAQLHDNTAYFRKAITEAGFTIKPGTHPIVPIMLGDASLATNLASRLLQRGIYVIGFSYPVVPKGQARIRVQISAAHTKQQLEEAVGAFTEVGRELGVLQ